MKSLKKVMSIALAIAMMFTLLVPATFVSAEVAPALTMSIVDASGNAVSILSPGSTAYLRVSVSGLEQLFTMGITVNVDSGAEFNTTKSNINKRYPETAAFKSGDNEIMTMVDTDIILSESSVYLPLYDSTTFNDANPPVTVESFVLADVPFTVTADVGEDVSFSFTETASATYISVASGAANKWSIGHNSRPIIAATATKTVEQIPYAITAIAIDPELAAIPQNIADDYTINFEGHSIKAIYDLDRDDDDAYDTASYPIVTDLSNVGELTAYAYIYVPAGIAATKGEKTLGVTVFDSSIKDTNGDDAGRYSGEVSILVTDAVAKDPVEVRADDTKVVEVKYGTSNEDIIAAVQARDDLFKKIYTDGTAAAAEIDLTGATVDLGVLESTVAGETDVTVSNIAGVSAVEGTIKVKVNPTTITTIELTPAWEAKPEGKDGDAFPGFDGYVIKATYDANTSAIEYAEYPIVTDAAADASAYVDVSSYDAAAEGSYTFPVVLKNASAISADYEGNIVVTVAAAIDTDKVAIDESVAEQARINRGEADYQAAAVAEVESLIAAGLVKYVKTNGDLGSAVTEGITATAGEPGDNSVSVTLSGVTFDDADANVVVVSLGDPGVISAIDFVQLDSEGTYVSVPATIPAAIAEYADDASELAMDWSDYVIAANFAYPDVDGSAEVDYYEYYTDGATKYFEVEGWVDFEDGAEIGDQVVTIKIYDASKANEAGIAYTGTLTATITEANSANIVELKGATISVKNGTTEEEALEKLYDKAGLYEEIFKDGSAADSDVMITEATIADYNATTKGEYVVTVVSTDAADGIEVVNEAEVIIKVKAKASGGTKAGTVVGGGGMVGSSTVEKPEDPKPEDPKPEDPNAGESKPGTPIPEDHWAADIVENLTTAEVIDGAKETVESLDVTLTREEAAMIIAKALKLEMTGSVDAYTDAAEIAAEYKDYVAAATAAGIFEGNDDGTFNPKGNLTREQVAAVIIRAYGFGEGTGELKFADADQIGWAKGYVAKAAELGIVDGYSVDNTFRPTNSITRAEAFAIVSRAMNLKAALDDAIEEAPAEVVAE